MAQAHRRQSVDNRTTLYDRGQHKFFPRTVEEAAIPFLDDGEKAIKQVLKRAENIFETWALITAALGFLTDSYNLFAFNVVLPAISYVYWRDSSTTLESALTMSTLLGTMCGQILFGYLADKYGRRTFYTVEMLIVVISTLQLFACSPGFSQGDGATSPSTWSFTVSIFVWRIAMAIGIGAEYPLSAVITAEWSAARIRARMMGVVFFMQPLGQFLAYLVAMIVNRCYSGSLLDVDRYWRVVVIIGVLPTLLGISARFFMRESWRYTWFVVNSPKQALEDLKYVYGLHDASSERSNSDTDEIQTQTVDARNRIDSFGRWLFYRADGEKLPKNFLTLLGVSLPWFWLDFVFYGMGYANPAVIAKLWEDSYLKFDTNVSWWESTTAISAYGNITLDNNGGYGNSNQTSDFIHQAIFDNSWHLMVTTSVAAIIGTLLFVLFESKVNRRLLLIHTFWMLSIILAITAGVLKAEFQQAGHTGLIVLWVLAQLLISLGPNVLTFIIPAEVFPTRFRCTCYGIAAASGKLGAIVVSIIPWAKPDSSDGDSTLIGLISSFAVVAAIGSLTTYLLTPDAQNDKENLTLEQLTDDSDLVPREGGEDEIDASSEKVRSNRQVRWWYLCF